MVKHPQKLGQMIFAAVFFCSVIGYGALNLWYAKEPLAENVQEAWDNIREEPAAETVVNAVADLDTAEGVPRPAGRRPVHQAEHRGLRRDAAGLGKARGKCF